MLVDPRHPGWGVTGFPDWVRSFRSSQRDAVAAVVEAFENDSTYVVLSAPTGSGKTLVAEAARRALHGRAVYVCVDKGLQHQVLRDFPYANVLKGRANYPTLDRPERFEPPDRLSCDDCIGRPCRWCHPMAECPYRAAKRAATEAKLAVLNTAYLLAEANVSENAAFTDLDFVVADEADRLESALMSHVSVGVGVRRLEEWKLEPLPNGADPCLSVPWVQDRALPALEESIRLRLERDPGAMELRTQRELRWLRKLRLDLQRVLAALPGSEWVTTQVKGAVEFKPVRVAADAPRALWRHASRWLLMSATVIDAQSMMRDLGVADPWSWTEVEMPSLFPVENRPVYLCDVAHVTHKNARAPLDIADALQLILDRHAGDRVLVHTVSFRLQNDLEQLLAPSGRHVWYRGAAEREAVLRRYLDEPSSVLFAPAMERGIDLPDEACRAVVVCKVPYPDLGDAQIAARLARGDRVWYRTQALRSLVQMCGRGVRHEHDACPTYVLDSQANRIVAEARGALPRWWRDALVKGMPA